MALLGFRRYGSCATRCSSRDRVPDHSWLYHGPARACLCRTPRRFAPLLGCRCIGARRSRSCKRRARPDHGSGSIDWVLALIAEAGLVKGERVGVDASTMEANACATVRRDSRARVTGGCWRAWPRRAASRHPRPRTWRAWTASASKKLSNQDWVSKSDRRGQDRQDAQDGTTHLAYKPDHAVDAGHRARWWPPSYTRPTRATLTLEKTLAAAKENLERWTRHRGRMCDRLSNSPLKKALLFHSTAKPRRRRFLLRDDEDHLGGLLAALGAGYRADANPQG